MSAVRVSIYDTITGRVISFVSGTLVNDDVVTAAHLFDLRLPKGEINDILDSLSFEQPSNNKGFWCIAHPYTNMEGVGTAALLLKCDKLTYLITRPIQRYPIVVGGP